MQDDCKISQPEGHHFAAILLWFRILRNLPSTSCYRLPMALTSSFKLRIAHHLKHWISVFLSFETTYSMHNWAPESAPKVSNSFCPLECFMLDFSLFPPCSLDLLMAKDYEASKLWFFMLMSFQFLCCGFHKTFLNLGLLWWSNYYQKHQNLHNLIKNDCKGP